MMRNFPARNSLSLRLLGAAAIWLAVALAAAGFGLSAVFDRQVASTYERQLALQLERLAARLDWSPEGRLHMTAPPSDPAYRRPYSGRYWQVSVQDGASNGALFRSESLWDQALALPSLAHDAGQEGAMRRYIAAGPDGQSLLVIERGVQLPGADTWVRIAAAVDRAEMASGTAEFNRLLVWALALLGLGLMAAVTVQIVFGLWPLKRLRQSLVMLRDQRQRRLDGAWPTEVQPLADEINELLERDEAVLARTRRQAADLAHALKTPLSILSNEAARGHSALHAEVGRQAEAMRRQIERHLARARAAGAATQGGTAVDAAAAVRALADALGKIHRDRQLHLAVHGSGHFAGDREDLIEMLGNLLENACHWARGRIDIAVAENGGRLHISIDDDGPGMPATHRTQALQRFERLDEAAAGSGLGLSIVADIAAMYRGGLTLDHSPHGGLRAVLELPASAAPDTASCT